MHKTIIAALVVVVLAGCATDGLTPRERLLARAKHSCTEYGFPPGTPAFAQCMQQVDAQQRQQADAASDALIRYSQWMSTPPPQRGALMLY